VDNRCHVIPLLSRWFLQIHKDQPPLRKEWSVHSLVTKPMVGWFLKIAPTVETLTAHIKGPELGLLPQLLAMTTIVAPSLQELSVYSFCEVVVGSATLDGLAFLSQIKKLDLALVGISESENVASLRRLSGLRSLQVDLMRNSQAAFPVQPSTQWPTV